MDKHANSQIVYAVEKLVETRADLMEPYFVDKVLKSKVILPSMAYSVSKIILCVVVNYEVCKITWLLGCFEDLCHFSDLSAMSLLAGRR